VIVAVSGGPDSVCLLHALRELNYGVTGVAHFNHKLRSEASDLDERFVAATARDLGIEFHRSEGALAPGNLEQAARRARREFFADLLQRGLGDRIALGHTRDDQAETVLFRILRGSGLAGLAGVLPVTAEGFVRPLLDVTRAEVEAFLRARNIPHREDASNRDERFARNRIRHRVLPALAQEWNPQLREALAHLADLAYEEERWWASEIARRGAEFLVVTPGAVEFHASQLAELPLAISRRLVRQAMRQVKGDLASVDFRHVERVIEIAQKSTGSGRAEIPGVEVVRSFDWIRMAVPGRPVPAGAVRVTPPGKYPAPDGNTLICLDIIPTERKIRSYATLKWKAESLELRGWRPGDHYRPAGHSRDQKLKDLFQQSRVPSWRRLSWPILSYEGRIVWARQFGSAAQPPGAEASRFLRILEIPAGR